MATTAAACTFCGSPFRGNEAACTYCRAARPVPALDDGRVRQAVEVALREDRNHNGIPDVLEPRMLPLPVTVMPAPRPQGSIGQVVGVMLGVVFTFAFLGLVVFAASDATSQPAATRPAATVQPFAAAPTVETAAPVVTTAPPLAAPPPTATVKAKPKAPTPRPSPTPVPAPASTPKPASAGWNVGF